MYFVCIYVLLKVVSHYDLSVLSVSVMSFHKKCLDRELGGRVSRVSSIQFVLGFS